MGVDDCCRPEAAIQMEEKLGGKGGRLKDRKFLRTRAPKRGRCRRVLDRRAALMGTIVQVRAWKLGMQPALWQIKVTPSTYQSIIAAPFFVRI